MDDWKENKVSYEDIINSVPMGLLIFQFNTDDSIKILTLNDRLVAFANQLHLSQDGDTKSWNRTTLSEQFQNNLYAFASSEDRPQVKAYIEQARENGIAQCVFRLNGSEGNRKVWIKTVTSSKVDEAGNDMMYTLFQDCTKQMQYESMLREQKESLVHITRYDSMTNIQNRYSYHLFLTSCEHKSLKNTGILFADINGLKYVNDTYGHSYGDHIIGDFAQVLKKHFMDSSLYRISGDEFVAVITDIEESEFKTRMHAFIDEVDETKVASVGFVWESTILNLKQEVMKSEEIMHVQKKQYYADNRNTQFSRYRPVIMNKLIQDLEEMKYFVVLQPKADINSTEVIGAEALVRKLDQQGKVIPPYEFVPLLEKEMLISKLDFFVLEEVCKVIHRWKKEGKRLIRISVNLSRVTIVENNLIEHILRICDKYEVDHKYIEFEITESTETKDERKLIEIVNALHDLGFSISLDDMGNDYSSIKMLTIKDIDVVKLDRSFILGMDKKEGSALVRYIIALCHEIGKKCIAEGVENSKQRQILADMKCDFYQGYLLNRPIEIKNFEQYLMV